MPCSVSLNLHEVNPGFFKLKFFSKILAFLSEGPSVQQNFDLLYVQGKGLL